MKTLGVNDITEAIGRIKFDPELPEAIIGKMMAENAKNFSDSEIDRCLKGCVAEWLPRVTKTLRDLGQISKSRNGWKYSLMGSVARRQMQ